jgi:hypothetical protein
LRTLVMWDHRQFVASAKYDNATGPWQTNGCWVQQTLRPKYAYS